MGENEELKALKCNLCGAGLVKGYRSEYDDDDEETIEIPIAQCSGCGHEYDQYTQEYYEVYADDLTYDKDNSVFSLGKKGIINDIEYEIIGRIRFQEEDEYEKSTWDEWIAINTTEGSYHFFVEEEGKVHSYQEYVPESIDLESDSSNIEFEGKKISRDTGYVGRIVYSEGELPWEPEIGEAVTMYDFKKGGDKFSIEHSEDEVSITKGERIPYEDIIDAFAGDEEKELYDKTMKMRKQYKVKARVYMVAFIISFGMSLFSCFSGSEVQGVMNGMKVLANNEHKYENNQSFYFSQVLYGPFRIESSKSLYDANVSIDESVQRMNLGWQSFRLMLVKEERLNKVTNNQNNYGTLRSLFNEIDSHQEPVESFVINGDFWDEQGYDSEGYYWHENDLSASQSFVLDDPGMYYIYLELSNSQYRLPNSVKVKIDETGSYKYYMGIMVVLLILMLLNRSKSNTYNALPFHVAAD